MIKSTHGFLSGIIFKLYLKRLLSRHFEGVYLVNDPPALGADEGLVLCPNHMSWWDGFFVYWLNHRIYKRRFFIMMLEEQLKKLWFFRQVGAFSITPGKPHSVIDSARYARAVIGDPRNVCVIFPQGQLQPYSVSRIVLQPGLRLFLSGLTQKTSVVPLAMKIQFERKSHPRVYLRFGQTHAGARLVHDAQDFNMDSQRNLEELEKAALSMVPLKDILR